MKQIPTMRVRGPVPLPRTVLRRQVLKSPFKFGEARETWELRRSKRLIIYETDTHTHNKFIRFLRAIQVSRCRQRSFLGLCFIGCSALVDMAVYRSPLLLSK